MSQVRRPKYVFQEEGCSRSMQCEHVTPCSAHHVQVFKVCTVQVWVWVKNIFHHQGHPPRCVSHTVMFPIMCLIIPGPMFFKIPCVTTSSNFKDEDDDDDGGDNGEDSDGDGDDGDVGEDSDGDDGDDDNDRGQALR